MSATDSWPPKTLPDELYSSLPLDRARRLGRDVVGHAVDAAHLVDDAVGDAAEEGVVEGELGRELIKWPTD
jgi:hypothetical protein